MEKEIKLTPSLEDYLETIFHLEKINRVARVKDIAAHMDVKMPSVTGAVKNLRDRGLVNYERNSYISLTDEGMKIASSVESRHNILAEFLQDLALIPQKDAQDQACLIEHHIDLFTARRIAALTKFFKDSILSDPAAEAAFKKALEI